MLLFLTLLIGALMPTSHNLSHEQRPQAKETIAERIQARGDLPYASVERQLQLLEELHAFGLGRFLIETGGLNGAWTHYVVQHPLKRAPQPLTPLEDFILNRAPTTLATQQRFALFKTHIQAQIREGCSFASIPSGVMADLLDLDYSNVKNFQLTGIDLDPESLRAAADYATKKGLRSHSEFLQEDAWMLGEAEEFDVIASNGLTIYEPDNAKVVDLYRAFYRALKPKGKLVTSFLTPPPIPGNTSEWELDQVNRENALLQKILFVDILQTKWQVFRPESVVKQQLREAGFEITEILYDKAHIFPTIVATKI